MKDKKLENFPYDLKYDIARFILPRLELFYQFVGTGKNQSVPSDLGLTLEESQKKWVEILGKMKVPFEYLVFPEKFNNLTLEELESQREEGVKLFCQYFDSLWD